MLQKTVEFVLKYIVETNVFISLCAIAFYLSGGVLLGIRIYEVQPSGILVVFFSTLLVYNVSQTKFGIVHFMKFRSTKNIVLYVAVLLSLVTFSWEIPFVTLLYMTHLGIISIIYNSPLLNDFRYLPLRSIPLIKIFIIGYIWASMGSFLPGMMGGIPPGLTTWLVFWAQFFFILGITLPFDIRDFYRDYKENLKTIPGIIGIGNTKRLSYCFLVAHFILMFYVTEYAWWLLPVVALALWLTKKSSASRADCYYTVYIDALIILQFLAFVLSERSRDFFL